MLPVVDKKPATKPDLGRSARFSASVDTGRWWRGHPEQAQVFVEAHNRTLRVGLCTSTLVANGVAATGLTKPKRYRQSSRALYHDLSDTQQIEALLTTFRYMAAYSAGVEAHPYSKLYWLQLGERRELCRVQLSPGRFQTLEVECEDANFRSPGFDAMARERARREKAGEQAREHRHQRRYCFKIKRISELEGEPYRCYEGSNSSEFTIPLKGVRSLVEHTSTLLLDLWKYLGRHPEQVQLRYTCFPESFVRRWQLHHPEALDTHVVPMVRYSLAYVPEEALLTHPWVYRHDPDRVHSGHFTRLYLERLRLYAEGKLRWNPKWSISEYQAQMDVHKLRMQQVLAWCCSCYTLLWTVLIWLISKAVRPLRTFIRYQAVYEPREYRFSPPTRFIPVPRQRGPPL